MRHLECAGGFEPSGLLSLGKERGPKHAHKSQRASGCLPAGFSLQSKVAFKDRSSRLGHHKEEAGFSRVPLTRCRELSSDQLLKVACEY